MKPLALTLVVAAVVCFVPTRCLSAEPLYEGLGDHHRPITTSSPEAQKYFDQGLKFIFGFNHGAAIRSFEEAVRLDPNCAMAHWGIAYANGPHINFPLVPPDRAEMAWKELQLAQQNASTVTQVEKDLIQALSHRYAHPQPEDRKPLDEAYADAMRKVWKAHPMDTDIGVLFAESLMDLRPWDQWTPEGEMQPGTEEVLRTLDAVLKLDINHPFANHLFIHAVEASKHPERAEAAADRLRKLQPGLAHNVHMPTHIDIRLGNWQKAIDSNAEAVEADAAYRALSGPPTGFINVYVAHNRHMLTYAAMMTGQGDLAMEHIRAMVAGLPKDFLEQHAPLVEAWAAMPIEVLVRFGRWDEVLAEPEPQEEYLHFTRAFRHAARAIAYAAKGDVAAARKEQQAYLEGTKQIPEGTFIAGNNEHDKVTAIITPMVEGEILVAEGKVDGGIAQLRQAIAAEDQLKYDEPRAWMIPVRHSLGAVLMRVDRYPEAEQVYREDLKLQPNNGWSLYGLFDSLRRQNKSDEAAEVEKQFKNTWAKADVEINSSCLCQPAVR